MHSSRTSFSCNYFWLSVFAFLVAINSEALAGDIGITRGGAGVSQWDNSTVVGNAAGSSWSSEGGLVINPSYSNLTGTEATYRFLIPSAQLYGSMTNLCVYVYGKGKAGTLEPSLYAGPEGNRIPIHGSLPQTEDEHGPYMVPLSCLTEAEGTIPGYWLDITLHFTWDIVTTDWYDIKYVKVEYSFSNVDQQALENYQSILNATQTLWVFYAQDANTWPHAVASTDGMERTYMAVVPGYDSALCLEFPVYCMAKDIIKLPKLYQGLKGSFEEYFAFTDFVQHCTVSFNMGSGNEASYAFSEMADLADIWKSAISDNGQIDSDEISGINSEITNAKQRASNLEAKISDIGQDLKNIRNIYSDEGVRNCAKAGLLLLSPMIEFDPNTGDKLSGGYLPPLLGLLESMRPGQLGSLTVSLTPSSARWRLYGNGKNFNWQNSEATVPNIPTGTYTIEFSGVSGYITPSPITNFTISAGINTKTVNYQQSGGVTFNPWYDTYVNQQYGTAKYYSAESLLINNTTNQKYTFIGFDLDDIPSGSTINKAEFHLQFLCTNSSVIDMYKITDNVSGGNNDSIAWNNQPDLGFHYGTFALGASPSSGDTREWIITCTSAIQTQVNSNDDWEFCMKINDLNSDVSFNIISSEWSFDETPGPYLYVEYTPPQTYALNLAKSGNGSIRVNGTLRSLPWSGTFTAGSSITLQAEPDNCWQFSNWSGSISGSTNPKTITMDGSKNITANFTQSSYTLNLTKTGNGCVTINGLLGPSPWSETFAACSNVTIEAVEERLCEGVEESWWKFNNWSGSISGNTNPITISMDASKNITANFIQVGSLQVTITSQDAVNAGARWLLNGVEYSSGQVVPNLTVGSYQVSFKDIAGFAEPNSRTIEIVQRANTDSGTYSKIYSGGSGVGNDPFVISHAGDLLAMRDNPASWSNCFALEDDIYLAGCAISDHLIGSFSGKFDGNGKRIVNLTIINGGDIYKGMIRSLSGEVRNLGLEDCNITGQGSYVGGICGVAGPSNSIIENCYVTGSITGYNACVGGLAGSSFRNIHNCYTRGIVSGRYAGGLVGSNYGIVRDCYSTCSVDGEFAGGLISWNGGSTALMENSFWNAKVQMHDVNNAVYSNNDGAVLINVDGLDTNDMQTQSTYADAGWDFTTPVWKICDGTNYPKLAWQKSVVGDFVCPEGVNFNDFAVLASAWMSQSGDTNWDGRCDISEPQNNRIDIADLLVFASMWFEGTGSTTILP